MKMRSLAACGVIGLLASPALADINYGDFSGNDFDFLSVTEDSTSGDPLPLFGSPTVSGNSLDFNPTFSANAEGAGGLDIVEGQLNFTVEAHDGASIDMLEFAEAGDYTLVDPGMIGTVATAASVSAAFFIEVLEVDGVSISGVNANFNMTFSPSHGTFNVVDDGTALTMIWSGELNVDIQQMLADEGIFGDATMVSVALNNTLVASSEDGTIALIAKKDFDGLSVDVVPAPGAIALLAIAGMVPRRRRRR